MIAGSASMKNMLYFGGGGYLIGSLNTANGQVSAYSIVPSPQGNGYGGVQTLAMGADDNIWVFLGASPYAYVFFPSFSISAAPALLKVKPHKSASVTVSEGNYTGQFTSSGGDDCATVEPQESSGAFTVSAVLQDSCFVSFSDTLGSGTVYVQVEK
jgi:hypothetical protein